MFKNNNKNFLYILSKCCVPLCVFRIRLPISATSRPNMREFLFLFFSFWKIYTPYRIYTGIGDKYKTRGDTWYLELLFNFRMFTLDPGVFS